MKKPLFSLFLISLFLFTACSSVETIEIKNEAGQLTETISQNKKTKQKEGTSYLFFEDGTILEEASYQNNVLHGERTIYYEDGQVQIVEQYTEGNFEGPFKTYYNNGQIELEGHYIKGSMNGSWTRYYETGQRMEVVQFENNEENGPFMEYYKNGQPKAKGHYLHGDNEQGELSLFDESGELVTKMDCEKGRCKTIWSKEMEKKM